MSSYSYTEFGIEIKHVRYAVRIPELPSLKLRKPKLLKMKRPKIMKRRRRSMANTGTLDSLNVDWKKEFDQKYADLIFKTEEKKKSNSSLSANSLFSTEECLKRGFQDDLANISFSSQTYSITSSPVNLSSLCLDRLGEEAPS